MNIDDDDDGPPQLSAETLKALQEWQQEQENNKTNNVPGEDWITSGLICPNSNINCNRQYIFLFYVPIINISLLDYTFFKDFHKNFFPSYLNS
ncbi:unnamed protein product [Rotaria magnacalcarata]